MKDFIEGEEWRDVVGYEGRYEVSNLGRVYSLPKRINSQYGHNGQQVAITDNGRGYKIACLSKDCKRKNHYVHRLVAQNFIPNPIGYEQVNHMDGNKSNNCVDNLEWCDVKYNAKHASENGLIPKGKNNVNTRMVVDIIEKKIYRWIEDVELPLGQTFNKARDRLKRYKSRFPYPYLGRYIYLNNLSNEELLKLGFRKK